MEESRWSGIEIYIPLFILVVSVTYWAVTNLLNHILFWIFRRFFNREYSQKAKNRTLYLITITGIIILYLFH